MALHITLCLGGLDAAPWQRAFSAALAQAHISVWEPGALAADYAVVWAPPQAFIDGQPRLRAIFNIGAGVDALLALRLPPGVPVVRLDDAGMAVQMAEYVCYALIRQFREFPAYEAEQRAARWAYRRPLDRAQWPVGILGLGVLGARVARAVAQFEFPVLGWSRSPKTLPGVRSYAGDGALDEVLRQSRVLVNLLPLSPQTRGILNRRTLSLLPRGAHLIHIARGAHLVEDDLIALLDSGQLASATLDVFAHEPLPPQHPFWRHPAITITPHASARTLRDEAVAQIAHKIGALERGEPVAGVVDVARGY